MLSLPNNRVQNQNLFCLILLVYPVQCEEGAHTVKSWGAKKLSSKIKESTKWVRESELWSVFPKRTLQRARFHISLIDVEWGEQYVSIESPNPLTLFHIPSNGSQRVLVAHSFLWGITQPTTNFENKWVRKSMWKSPLFNHATWREWSVFSICQINCVRGWSRVAQSDQPLIQFVWPTGYLPSRVYHRTFVKANLYTVQFVVSYLRTIMGNKR